MRLLNTTTLEFRDFFVGFPTYAILSHRWISADDGGEATYREFLEQRTLPEMQWAAPASMHKVRTFCQLARSQNIQWAWSDTCCINKDSDSELTESINSMWNWYAESKTCIVYLSDVTRSKDLAITRADALQSVWFTRAWTLQELLAPKHMTFYDRNWKPIGTREDMCDEITYRTGIQREFFGNLDAIKRASAAKRLSWAAGRRATRPEDVAYSLVGIMGIYVSPRYGSGKEEAFKILQLEFTKKNRDMSIFAWTMPGTPREQEHGMFAPDPDAFARSGAFRPTKYSAWAGWRLQDTGLLTGLYFCWVKRFKRYVKVSLDCVDDQGRVPRLRFRSSKGIDRRIHVDELDLKGRGDHWGRSFVVTNSLGEIIPITFASLSRLNIVL